MTKSNELVYTMRLPYHGDITVNSMDTIIRFLLDLKNHDEDSFLILSMNEPLHNVSYIQTAFNPSQPGTGIGLYQTEARVDNVDGSVRQFRWMISDIEDLKQVFTDYYESQKVPDFSKWEDVTKEVYG